MDKNTRIKTLYKAYLKRWDKDSFFKENCNVFLKNNNGIFEWIYYPYTFKEFYKELNNESKKMYIVFDGISIEQSFNQIYGDFLLKRNFTMFGYNDINKENSIDYCHFLLKHKGKLHNRFGNRYKSLVKELQEIVNTNNLSEYFTMSLQCDSFFLRTKYDKKLKRLMKKQYSKKPKYISKQFLNKFKTNEK